ncbi:MAG: mechanosensitive ion channel domain-containing protein [Myxococcota bacterium]
MGTLAVANALWLRRASTQNRLQRQLAILALSGAAVVSVVLALPISEALRSQLLSLLGLLVSAAIALASTTFMGNALAGMMLRGLGNFRSGDFVRVGDHFGRVSERGLFHVEIQTEDRDLVTLPNLYLVTQPVKVVHRSGTFVSASVSLGYAIPHTHVRELLLRAAERAELSEAYVHVSELGDYSVRYRVAGFLGDAEHLLGVPPRLRGCMLDVLHGAGVEIVSPTFMNQRQLSEDERAIPPAAASRETDASRMPDEVIFDKAIAAETREELESESGKLGADLAEPEAEPEIPEE